MMRIRLPQSWQNLIPVMVALCKTDIGVMQQCRFDGLNVGGVKMDIGQSFYFLMMGYLVVDCFQFYKFSQEVDSFINCLIFSLISQKIIYPPSHACKKYCLSQFTAKLSPTSHPTIVGTNIANKLMQSKFIKQTRLVIERARQTLALEQCCEFKIMRSIMGVWSSLMFWMVGQVLGQDQEKLIIFRWPFLVPRRRTISYKFYCWFFMDDERLEGFVGCQNSFLVGILFLGQNPATIAMTTPFTPVNSICSSLPSAFMYSQITTFVQFSTQDLPKKQYILFEVQRRVEMSEDSLFFCVENLSQR